MNNNGIVFEIMGEDKDASHGWYILTWHIVFDVKMDFTITSRWVLNGRKTPDHMRSTYVRVVSRESVRTEFTYTDRNAIYVFAAVIRNDYPQAPSSQKDYIVCGPEFGIENFGDVFLIHKAVYGGKSAGRDFRNHLR